MKIKRYLPIAVVFAMSLVLSFSIHFRDSPLSLHGFFNGTMGFFLCLLAMFKLFNLPGFADGFQMYDIVAKRVRIYAYCYPFIELTLGVLFLTGLVPLETNVVTLLVMAVSALGVIKSLLAGMDIRCACLGTALDVPLSTVSVVENVGMGVMAAINLYSLVGQ